MPTREEGQVQFGQLYDTETGVVLQYTEQMQQCNEGEAVTAWGSPGKEVIPHDANSAVVKTFDLQQQEEDLLDLFYGPIFTTIDNIRLPDELRGITVTFTQSSGEGTDDTTGANAGSGPMSISGSSKSSSSAGIVVDIQPNIRPHYLDNVDGALYYFYAKSGQASKAEILARLTDHIGTTVNGWPAFFPDPISIAAFQENISVSASGSAQSTLNSSGGTGISESAGHSIEIQPSVRSQDISPTLHRTIAITNKSATASVTAVAGVVITGTGDFLSVTGGDTVPSQEVNASVFPTQISATSPSQVPVTGLYLYNTRINKGIADLFFYAATVVNAAVFQSPIIDFNYNNGAITVPDGTFVSIAPDFHGGFPDSYSLHSGSFATSGLSLDTATGIISGTTLGATEVTVTIRATNALTAAADATLVITVEV